MICPRESAEQEAVVEWLDRNGVLFCAVPNGARRSPRQGARLKAQGMRAGAPDILIFAPPPQRPACNGVALEMKRRTGGRVSPAQRDFLSAMASCGWVIVVGRGAADAIRQLRELGYGW